MKNKYIIGFLILFAAWSNEGYIFAKDIKEEVLSLGPQELLLILQDIDLKTPRIKLIWYIDSVPSEPAFTPLTGDLMSYESIKGRKVLTQILSSRKIINENDNKEIYIDILGTYLIDEKNKSGGDKVEHCHACQVLIGVVISEKKANQKVILYKNLFLTMDGSWGAPPEISLIDLRSMNYFKIGIRHSYMNMGQLTKYQYVLRFDNGYWSELERRIEVNKIEE